MNTSAVSGPDGQGTANITIMARNFGEGDQKTDWVIAMVPVRRFPRSPSWFNFGCEKQEQSVRCDNGGD